VAVVAVHGVADQKPAASARQIADLLCADSTNYTEFTEVSVRLPRAPMVVDENVTPGDPGLAYMHQQLVGYEGDGAGAVYDTVRLEGKRKRPNGQQDDVHVHEVYWADLSRIGESTYRVFAELYQLLLHLPSLGRNAMEGACAANKGRLPWKVASHLTAWAVWLFTVPIPLLNVVMLSLVLVAVSAEISAVGMQVVVAAALPTIAAVAAGGLLLPKLKKPLPRRLFFALFGALILGGVGGAVLIREYGSLYRWVAGEAAIVAIAVCAYIASKYNVMKKGALAVGLVASVIASSLAIVFLFAHPETEAGVYMATMNAAEVLSFVIVLAWLGVTVLVVTAAVAGLIAVKTTPREERTAASRAAWSGRFAVAFPAALFITITMGIWFLITTALSKIMPVTQYQPFDFLRKFSAAVPLNDFMFDMVKTHGVGVEVLAAALALFLLAAVWGAGASVFQEVATPKPDDNPVGVGQWLTRGISLVVVAGDLLTWSFVLLVGLTVGNALNRPLWDSQNFLVPILAALAALLGAIMTTKNLTTSVRAAVDVLLDVDNYMRESPRHATPRARIAERYVSLLRHLCASGYDKIILVAHSQGTVISADLLRYLSKVPRAKAANNITDIPIRLFTMGSPLRQLYAGAFPYLYRWIDDDPLPDPPADAPWLHRTARPHPDELVVEQWVNAYRTGDYVGRHLWVNEDKYLARIYVRSAQPYDDDGPPPTRVQFCVGAGAHTHYWDRHGAEIGQYITKLMD
jgi:hypothetical protein